MWRSEKEPSWEVEEAEGQGEREDGVWKSVGSKGREGEKIEQVQRSQDWQR